MAKLNFVHTNGKEFVNEVGPKFVEHTLVENLGMNFSVFQIDEHTAIAFNEGTATPNLSVFNRYGIRATGPAIVMDIETANTLPC